MISYKKFSLLAILFLLSLVFFHGLVWNTYTKFIFPENYHIGDLGRASYSLDSLFPRVNKTTLQKQHIEFNQWNGKPIDILTIGDSFSNGGSGGLNSFYQDYIATQYNLTILNIQVLEDQANYIEMIYLLKNSGLLDKIKPKAIILESNEKSVLERFAISSINTNKDLEQPLLEQLLTDAKWDHMIPSNKIRFINNININAVKYNIFYNFNDHAYSSSCYQTKLKQNMFSCKNQNILLFHESTLPYNQSITNKKIQLLNKNLNDLALFLKKQGITLYFMPVVDKFNLYSPWIYHNEYGQNTFFEQFRPMKKEYIFIDTKAILHQEIINGKKDIFYSDDTHWSYKASKTVINTINFKK